MTTNRLLLASLLAFGFLAACTGGPDDPAPPTTNPPGQTDPNANVPGNNNNNNNNTTGEGTFAGFVINLIQNQTQPNLEPVDIPENLQNTDDPNAFDVLFQ